MDANGTRFHLFLGAADWCERLVPDPEHPEAHAPDWDGELYERTLHQLVPRFAPPAGEPLLSPADRRGAGRDRFGNTYWIDADRTAIVAESSDDERAARYWPPTATTPRATTAAGFAPAAPPAQRTPDALGGLAVTTGHYLVAGTSAPPGLLAFDLRGGGPPDRLEWPAGVPFEPFDLAATPDGGAVVLDRSNARLWTLDEHLRVTSERSAPAGPDPAAGDFLPLGGGEPAPSVPAGVQRSVDLADSAPLAGDPASVAVLPDASVLVLDGAAGAAPSLLRRYRDGAPLGDPVPLADADLEVELAAHAMAVVPGDGLGTLFVTDRFGEQAYAFALEEAGDQLRARLARRYYPMQGYGGRGLVADRERAYYDSGDRWLPLVEQCRPRYEPDGWLRTAAPLDGGEPGCVWHRLMLDARMPPGGAVEVWSRAADEPAALRTVAWEREPSPIRHAGGPDRPYLRGLDAYEVWETLFQRARGRWLELRLHLTGDGRSSPRLRSMRVHYPRFSYLRNYLPAVYREDAGSASFLDRFLANVEGIDTQIEDRIASAQALLDPRSVPAEALDWLGSFFDVALDPAWSESRRRTFIAHALDLFRWRGTPRGLRMALRLALDDAPGADADAFAEPEGRCTLAYRIVETFRSRSAPAVTLGDPGEGPAVVAASPGGRWKPSDGGAALDERYAEYLGGGAKRAWPLTAPAARAAEWHAFNHSVLGFEPTARRDDPGDRARWRDFLARRYRSPRELATAYAIHAHDFGAVRLPTSLPPDGAPLEDWYRFETIVLATARLAHRFVVLLPARLDDDSPDHAADEARRRLAQRVVELQKPAHTVFGVRFYWSAFRLGEARLGEGTVIGRGSRSAGLLRPAVLGRDHVGESRLGGDPPPRLTRPPSFGRRPDSEEETT